MLIQLVGSEQKLQIGLWTDGRLGWITYMSLAGGSGLVDGEDDIPRDLDGDKRIIEAASEVSVKIEQT